MNKIGQNTTSKKPSSFFILLTIYSPPPHPSFEKIVVQTLGKGTNKIGTRFEDLHVTNASLECLAKLICPPWLHFELLVSQQLTAHLIDLVHLCLAQPLDGTKLLLGVITLTSLILSTFASLSPLIAQSFFLVVICTPLMVQIPAAFIFLMSAAKENRFLFYCKTFVFFVPNLTILRQKKLKKMFKKFSKNLVWFISGMPLSANAAGMPEA